MAGSKNVPASLIDEATSRHGRKQKNKTHNGKVGFFLRPCFHKQKPWTDVQLLGEANQKVNNKLTVRNWGGPAGVSVRKTPERQRARNPRRDG